jgi:hypothetical protein
MNLFVRRFRTRRDAVIFREPVGASRSVVRRRAFTAKISPQLERGMAAKDRRANFGAAQR